MELKAFEAARHMKYVTTIERMAKQDERLATQTEITLNLLKENISLETIARTTGLTIEQIQALQAQDTQ
jgi:predicted transposase YdaD